MVCGAFATKHAWCVGGGGGVECHVNYFCQIAFRLCQPFKGAFSSLNATLDYNVILLQSLSVYNTLNKLSEMSTPSLALVFRRFFFLNFNL